MDEAKNIIISGFKWACENGPLCGEPMRGIKAKLVNAELHEDPANRGPLEIMPVTGRALLGSFLMARPQLLEPMSRTVISAPPPYAGAISNTLIKHRSKITRADHKGPAVRISALIPAATTFSLAAEVRKATGGHASWQSALDHWKKVSDDRASVLIRDIRKRKGLPLTVPSADKFTD